MSERLHILIVDDDPMMAKTLQDILKVKGHEAEVACSGLEALEKVAGNSFDCVLSDIKMPDIDGVELYRAIKAKQPDLSVVLMTAYTNNKLVKEGLEEGVIAALTKPLDINALLSFFSALHNEQSVTIVDDDPQFCKTLGDILRARGFSVTQVTDPYGIVERVGKDGEVVLLDMRLNGINGLDVLKEIRERYPHLPVILVSGYRGKMAEAIEAAMRINAHTRLYKPFEVEDLLQLLTEVHRQELSRVLGQPVRKRK